MARKVFRSGNSLAVTLPPDAMMRLGIVEGSKVEVIEDPENRGILIMPEAVELEGVDEAFVKLVDEFIEQYRPALEALAER